MAALRLKGAGLPAICYVETRHMKAAIAAIVNKSDRNDARSMAQVIRPGCFKAAHVKPAESQELRALQSTRGFLVNKIRDHENEIRGALRPHGLKVARSAASGFQARVTREPRN